MIDIITTNASQTPPGHTARTPVAVPQQNISISLPQALAQKIQPISKEEFEKRVPQENRTPVDIYVVSDSVFSLYQFNGETYSKVRNLRTGEENIFPSLDSYDFYEALKGNRGTFFEADV